MGELRKKGAVHYSSELSHTLSLLAGFLVLRMIWSGMFSDMKLIMTRALKAIADSEPLTIQTLHRALLWVLYLLTPDILCLSGLVAAVAILATGLQTKWCVREKIVNLQLSHLNPVNGFKRVFSGNGIMNTARALVKLALIIPLSYLALKALAPAMVSMVHLSLEEVFHFTGLAIGKLFWKILYVLFALALFDYIWTKRQWLRQNRMTKQEVKEERKSVEGDEETRRKIQIKGMQRIIQRIKKSVPLADVVITNPTHYAVALKYDRNKMHAPTVVAKGAGFVAQRIKEIAREAGVPVLERKALARALYDAVEVGSEIPYELFRAVAEVLAYVYRLKNPYAYQAART